MKILIMNCSLLKRKNNTLNVVDLCLKFSTDLQTRILFYNLSTNLYTEDVFLQCLVLILHLTAHILEHSLQLHDEISVKEKECFI